jgi:Na+/H+ antiporter NhaD/arsenite permease-like protein
VISALSLILIIALIIIKLALVVMDIGVDFKLTYIALISALPILLFSRKRVRILQRLDWHTLIFFAAMFVLMASVWESGFFQSIISDMHIDITSITMILVISVVLSQFISNVPLVALYLPMLVSAGASTREMMALAAGSTMAGNLFILGAASNVIIIQNAEKRSGETLTFMEFAAIGIPLTILNTIIYWLLL